MRNSKPKKKSLLLQLLDVRDIKLNDIFIQSPSGDLPVNFYVDSDVADIGAKLTIELPSKTKGE